MRRKPTGRAFENAWSLVGLSLLYAKYLNQGVVVVGISLDEQLKPLRGMVTSKGMSWPQIHDADQSLVKLFNVKGTPTYYLLDREGQIAAKEIPIEKLGRCD